MSFNTLNIILFNTFFIFNCASSPTKPEIDTPTDNVTFYSLSGGKGIEVFTPENYDSTLNYPVLLLNDGEDMFGNHSWDMDKIIQGLIDDNMIEPIIAVAIHVGSNRLNWYIPYEDPWIYYNWGNYEPQADQYASFIFNNVLPFMKQKYSIDTEKIGIMGASLGGLISTWMGVNYPEKIKYSAGLSGSLWVADYAIFGEVDLEYDNGQMFWFDIGAATEEWNYYVPMYRALDRGGITPGKRSFYFEVPNALHNSFYWLQRIHMPILLFFGKEEPVSEKMEVILECIESSSTQGLKFRRLNPIITFSNGVKYSLAHTAEYTLLSETGELGSEGSFLNNPSFEMAVKINYQRFEETVTIPTGYCK